MIESESKQPTQEEIDQIAGLIARRLLSATRYKRVLMLVEIFNGNMYLDEVPRLRERTTLRRVKIKRIDPAIPQKGL